MAEELVTLELEGRDELDGEVRLSDFIAELKALRTALYRTQEEVTEEANVVEYRVASLSHASPYKVTIGIRSITPSHTMTPRKIARRFTASLAAVRRNHRYAQRLAPETLDSFKALVAPVGTKFKSAKVYMPTKPQIKIDQSFARNLEKLTMNEQSERDEIIGRLEQLNIHDRNYNLFRIYPALGPKFITCRARGSLREKIAANAGRRISVQGTAHYRKDAPFPHEMSVLDIDPLPLDDSLPRLSDLHGIAPDATGELSPEDFVREFRDANW
jgi:hypothetical protein